MAQPAKKTKFDKQDALNLPQFYEKLGLQRVDLKGVINLITSDKSAKTNQIGGLWVTESVPVYATVDFAKDVTEVINKYRETLNTIPGAADLAKAARDVGTVRQLIAKVAEHGAFIIELLGKRNERELNEYQNVGCFVLARFLVKEELKPEYEDAWQQTLKRASQTTNEYSFPKYLSSRRDAADRGHFKVTRYPFKNSIASLDDGILEVMLKAIKELK